MVLLPIAIGVQNMINFKNIYYRPYRRFNDHMPCKMEVAEALERKQTPRITLVLNLYFSGYTIEEIAEIHMGVTRERVRQILMKGCRK